MEGARVSIDALNFAKHQMTGNVTTKAVLLILADRASDHGIVYGGVRWIARVLECNPDTVTKHLGRLVDAGLILRIPRESAEGRRTTLTVLGVGEDRGSMLPAVDDEEFGATVAAYVRGRGEEPNPNLSGGVSHDAESGILGPETVKGEKTVTETQVRGEDDRTPRPVGSARIGGRAIDPARWASTVRALAVYREETGQRLGALTGRGHPSDAARRVHERLLDHPELGDEEVADVIRRTLASRWWGEGRPSIGVVFGPRVFQSNLDRPGVPERSSSGGSGSMAAIDRVFGGRDGDAR